MSATTTDAPLRAAVSRQPCLDAPYRARYDRDFSMYSMGDLRLQRLA
jgi:hypothetical protein